MVQTILSLLLRQYVIEPHSSKLISLAALGLPAFAILILVYFLLMFSITSGMKYFVARKPWIYQKIKFLAR